MADRAHSWTDWKISEIEKELDRIYSRAQKELGEKADKYFSKFGDAWKKKQAEVDAGKLSQDDFNKWFQGKVATGEHWFNMERQMAEELLHVNETATAYVNDQLPEVYSRNYNQTANGINGQISGYSFELVDASTVRRLATDDKTLLPYKYVDGKKDVRWNTQKVNSEVLQGILQGDSIPHLSKRLENVVGMNRNSAIRNARTSCTSAENKGRMDMINDAEDKGVHVQKGWMATNDDRTRDSHADLNGTFVDYDDLFDNGLEYPGDPNGDPSEVYNCFIGDTKIASNSEIVRSYKHEYEGRLITVKTSGGVNFTCTPNHPILTLRGWVAAESLKNGDNLIVTFGQNEFTFGMDPDVNHAFPRIDAIHKFFDKLGGKRTCALGVNFHGDVAASDVEIIAKKRLLRDGLNSRSVDSVDKFAFERTDKTLPNKRTFSKHLWRIWTTAFSFMRSRCKTLSLRFRSLRHAKVHGFRPIALLNSGRVKTLDNDVAGNIELIGKCLDGFSGMIFADNIVSIDFSSGRSHVYNLQTQNGYYFVNSIIPQSKEKSNGIFAIAKNCRCTLVYKVVAIGDNLVQYPGEEQPEEQKAEEEKHKVERNYNNKLASKMGSEKYDKLMDQLDDCEYPEVQSMYEKHLDDVGVVSFDRRAAGYCSGTSISVDIAKDVEGSSLRKPGSVFYHEAGHANDHLLAREKGTGWYYSTGWNGGEYQKTIVGEVNDWVSSVDKQLKADFKEHKTDIDWLKQNGFLSQYSESQLKWYADKRGVTIDDILTGRYKDGNTKYYVPSYSKSHAYSFIEKEIKNAKLTDSDWDYKYSDLSDILEGATKGKIQCGWGHGKSYWNTHEVAVEAFAEMSQAHVTGPESLEILEKYLPQSVDCYRRMIADAVGG